MFGNLYTWRNIHKRKKYKITGNTTSELCITNSYLVTVELFGSLVYWIKSFHQNFEELTVAPQISSSIQPPRLLTIHYSTTKKPHKAILLILRRRVIYFLWHVKIIKHGGGQDFERAHLLVASRLGIFPNTLSQQTCAQPINHLLLMWEDLISIFCSVTAKSF